MRRLFGLLGLALAAACGSPQLGPVQVEQGWQMEGLVVERRGDQLVVRSDDGQTVRLTVLPTSDLKIEARPLPSTRALFEGDRVLATWTGGVEGGQAIEVAVTRDIQWFTAQALDEGYHVESGDWVDTMDSPGGTMEAPASIGTSDYESPLTRQGPEPVNPLTGEKVPADDRESF